FVTCDQCHVERSWFREGSGPLLTLSPVKGGLAMLARLAAVLVRRRRWVWAGAVVFVVVAAVLGGSVEKRLSSGGFADPNAESTKAGDLLRDDFGQQDPNLVIVLTAKSGS